MIKVNSTFRIDNLELRKLSEATVVALEKTGEAVHTEVVQAQVMPFVSGNLQEESTFVDYSNSAKGRVTISSSTPYARRLYFHPEYKFDKSENPNAGGKWYTDWLPGGKHQNFVQKAFAQFYKIHGGL